MPEHLQEIISQHYRSAWLVCKNTSPDFTHTGSKPGIPLADLLFIAAFTRAKNVIRADFTLLGLINKLSWSGERELGVRQPRNYSSALMCDTSYADDYMLGMLIQDCNTAIQACSVTFSIVFRHSSALGPAPALLCCAARCSLGLLLPSAPRALLLRPYLLDSSTMGSTPPRVPPPASTEAIRQYTSESPKQSLVGSQMCLGCTSPPMRSLRGGPSVL